MKTRFAPSPTGPLHLGHAYSAILAHDMARAVDGEFLLRIEDIDQSRVRSEWEELIYEDLSWLGLTWDGPVMRQSERLRTYRTALMELWQHGLLFACSCSRADIRAAISAPQEGEPLLGPDGLVYPGTCRARKVSPDLPAPPLDMALRLDMAAAVASTGNVTFRETSDWVRTQTYPPETLIKTVGDVALARPTMGTSYHLSVVIDDAAQGISHVVRGQDLAEATQIHVVLQRLLNLLTPTYHHHRLIRDEAGKRLAKRDDARAIRLYREEGASPEDIRRMVGL